MTTNLDDLRELAVDTDTVRREHKDALRQLGILGACIGRQLAEGRPMSGYYAEQLIEWEHRYKLFRGEHMRRHRARELGREAMPV